MTYIVRPGHRAVEDLAEAVVALGGRHPVVGGAGVVLLARADEGEVLGAGDVVRGAPVEVAARAASAGPGEELAGADRSLGQALPLVLRAVAPDDVVGPTESRGVVHPASDGLAPAMSMHQRYPRPWPSGQTLRALGYDGGHHDSGCRRGPGAVAPRLLGACLGLVALLAGLHLWRPALLSRADLAVYDRLLAASSRGVPTGRVALVEVDERSLAEAGRWPWPRDRVAGLLDRIRALGAAVDGAGHPLLGGRRRRRRWREPARAAPCRAGRGAGGGARPRRGRDRLRLHVRPPRRPPVPAPLDRAGPRRVGRRSHAGAAGGRRPLQPGAPRGGGGPRRAS